MSIRIAGEEIIASKKMDIEARREQMRRIAQGILYRAEDELKRGTAGKERRKALLDVRARFRKALGYSMDRKGLLL